MPRPRFRKLAAAQQELIVDAALGEFAAHGFDHASLNRIIEGAGISKGSMYYYFDSKEDLYAYVIRDRLGQLLQSAGPFPIPSTRDPDEFWAAIVDYCERLMEGLLASPSVAALLRGWLAGGPAPAVRAVQHDAEQEALPWFEQVLAAGQGIGAVRTDLPIGLLTSVVMGMGQAMDAWLISRSPDDVELVPAVPLLIAMIRSAVAPA